jgi:hypothetical protein
MIILFMAENESAEIYATRINVGGAHVELTGNLLGGATLVYHRINEESRDRDPLTERIMLETGIHLEYTEKLRNWKNAPKETRGDKPEIQGENKVYEEIGNSHRLLNYAMNIRSKTFDDNWKKLTAKEALYLTFGVDNLKDAPINTTTQVEKAIENNNGKIGKGKGEIYKKTMDYVELFYANQHAAKEIGLIELEGHLAQIARSGPALPQEN